MTDEYKLKLGGTIYPDPNKKIRIEEGRIFGILWDAWIDDGRYFMEFEAARQGGGGITLEISAEAYEKLKQESTDVGDIIREFHKPK